MVVSCDRAICICILTDFSRRPNAEIQAKRQVVSLATYSNNDIHDKKIQFAQLESSKWIGLAVRRHGKLPVESLTV
jgi:hypothetical protein